MIPSSLGRPTRSKVGPQASSKVSPFAIAAGIMAVLSFGGKRSQSNESTSAIGALAIMMWLTVGPLLIFALGMIVDGLHAPSVDWTALGLGLGLTGLCGLVLFPWPIVRLWLIPRGRPKLAWALTRLSCWVWRDDVRGGALIAAAWAALRQADTHGELPQATAQWIEARRDQAPLLSVRWRLGGAGIVASGLLAAARGRTDAARELSASAADLAEQAWPKPAIAIAWAWLSADAMERGAWRELHFLTRTAPVRTRTLEFFAAVAARITGAATHPDDRALRRLWLLAPHRRGNRPLLERALAAPSLTRGSRPAARRRAASPRRDDPGEGTLALAMRLHAELLVAAAGTSPGAELDVEALTRVAAAWDRAFEDPTLERALTERSRVLSAGRSATERVQALRASVQADLYALIRGARIELRLLEGHGVLDAAARDLRRTLLDGLETSLAGLQRRVDAERPLAGIDEWRSFMAVREQYRAAAAIGGIALRRLAFRETESPVCALAVWLWNEREERALGNAIFHWLLAEAVIVDDEAATALYERNVECGV